MAELSIDPDYLRMLIVQVRGLMAKVPPELPNDGSNPTDDPIPPADLQDEEGDLTREEIVGEIRVLEPRQQAELVALMWLGRDDGEAADWDELVRQALERREVPTEDYLLDHPLLAEDWLDGMERLGLEGLG
jgi:Protein of unknown function (DUF3775)